MKTKRIVYHYRHVTSDMTELLEEIRREDEKNEVWLLTEQCDIPELYRYCQIHKPIQMWGHYLRGEPVNLVEVINPPISVQVVMYVEYANKVGGITTFIYNWCRYMRKYYSIIVVYERMDDIQVSKFSEVVETIKYDRNTKIVCDTIILNRLTDTVRPGISYKQSIQVCHACRQLKYRIPQDRDYLINVSQAAKETWGEESKDGIVIHNMPYVRNEPCLTLISATRVNTTDKGQNDHRMRKLAEMLDKAEIRYIWLNFADGVLKDMPKTFINLPAVTNIQPYIKKADYLVQLSDAEAYSMSILEALSLNTAVIATPFPSLFEEGFEDGKTGYIVPFDMKFDVRKLLEVPKFEYSCNTGSIIKQWRKILGNKRMKEKNHPQRKICIICKRAYFDMVLGRHISVGEKLMVTNERADIICNAGYCRRESQ